MARSPRLTSPSGVDHAKQTGPQIRSGRRRDLPRQALYCHVDRAGIGPDSRPSKQELVHRRVSNARVAVHAISCYQRVGGVSPFERTGRRVIVDDEPDEFGYQITATTEIPIPDDLRRRIEKNNST